ncbi:MAG: hypothetical protein WCV58_00560 [Patescibacteria group bacterium]
MEKVLGKKVEELKKTINDSPDNFSLYKKALICLIDNSDKLSKNVCIFTNDSEVIRKFVAAHSGMYVSQHNPNGLEAYLRSENLTGRFECEMAFGGREGRLYWSVSGKPLSCPYKFVSFAGNDNK